MKNERYCKCGHHKTQCECTDKMQKYIAEVKEVSEFRNNIDDIIQIIYDIAWSRNTIIVTKPDKEKLKKFVDDYKSGDIKIIKELG